MSLALRLPYRSVKEIVPSGLATASSIVRLPKPANINLFKKERQPLDSLGGHSLIFWFSLLFTSSGLFAPRRSTVALTLSNIALNSESGTKSTSVTSGAVHYEAADASA